MDYRKEQRDHRFDDYNKRHNCQVKPDWSKYIFRVKRYKEIAGDNIITEYILEREDGSGIGRTVFCNHNGVLTVSGDYGSWVFCREFHPKSNYHVSDCYWIEKLHIDSCQKFEFNMEMTAEACGEEWEDMIADDEEYDSELEEFYSNVETCEDEYEYVQLCREYNIEEPPFVREVPVQLLIVFDAFDEMCDRLAIEENVLE